MMFARNKTNRSINSKKECAQNDDEKSGFIGGFSNPQFGPSMQLIDPRWEQEVKGKMEEFQRNDAPELRFPPMESHQRKRIHELARRRNLVCKSVGNEPFRCPVLTRRKVINLQTLAVAQETQIFELTGRQKEVITRLLRELPINQEDIDNHVKATQATNHNRDNEDAYRSNVPQIAPPADVRPDIYDFRQLLPVTAHRNLILDAIDNNQVTIVTGGTGCGKTTQVPQFLLEESMRTRRPIRIICTQPRRLPAIAVAQRVAVERSEQLGDTVGYHIRLEQRTSNKTILTYCTSGVLLRMLSQRDRCCDATHLILDEVHERERNTDYLLIALREALRVNRQLKVVLMSATMEGNLDLFMDYFKDFNPQHIDVPSRLYTVRKFHLGEIMALTGYTPPQTIFNAGNWGEDSTTNDSFPTVTRFQPNVPAAGFGSRGMHVVQTAPNLRNIPQQNTQQNALLDVATQLAQMQTSESRQQVQKLLQKKSGTSQKVMDDVVDIPLSDEEGANRVVSDGNNYHQEYATQQTSVGGQGFGNNLGDYHQQYQYQQQPQWAQHSVPDLHQMDPHSFYPHGQQTRAQYHQGYHPQHTTFYVGPDGAEYYIEGTQGFPPENDGERRYAMQGNYQVDEYRRSYGPSQQMAPVFTEQAVHELEIKLKKREIDDNQLANTYTRCVGSFEESVDTDLCVTVIRYLIDSPIKGAILVFLPGLENITDVRSQLEQTANNYRNQLQIFCLHSQLQSFEQQRVFDRTPKGCRKVILSTNIAEASLTIDDVVFVVDCGKVKEKTYDHDSRISQLKVQWIAKSNAEQRSGRAGRCRAGYCFRLYSTKEYEALQLTQVAELQRVAIHEVVLHAKMFAKDGESVRDFINKAPEPPRNLILDQSIQFLQKLGALYVNEELEEQANVVTFGGNGFSRGFYANGKPPPEPALTSLGRIIAVLPLEPQLARLLLFGVVLKCVDPVLNLVAVLSHSGDPFLAVPSKQTEDRTRLDRVKSHFGHRDLSDHLMLIRSINEYMSVKRSDQQRWCTGSYIRSSTMRMIVGIRHQLRRELVRANIVKVEGSMELWDELNWNSDSWPMIRGAIVAGCYPGIGYVKKGNRLRKIFTSNDSNVQLHGSSIVKKQLAPARPDSGKGSETESEVRIEFPVFQELIRLEHQLTIKTVTVSPPLTTLLFSGSIRLKPSTFDLFRICTSDDGEIPEETQEDANPFGSFAVYSILELDNWFAARGSFSQLRLVLQLRFRLMDYFLKVMEQPKILYTTEFDNFLISLRTCLEEDHRSSNFSKVDDLQGAAKPDRKNMPRTVPRSVTEHSCKTTRSISSTTQSTQVSSSQSKSSVIERNYNNRSSQRVKRHKKSKVL